MDLVGLLLLVLLLFGVPCVLGYVGTQIWGGKGGAPWIGFVSGFFLGPLGLILVAVANPSNPAPARDRSHALAAVGYTRTNWRDLSVTFGFPTRIDRGHPLHVALRVLGVLAIAYLLLSPLFGDLKPNEFGELTDIVILAMAALSLNLLIGFTGQISIGHSAFFGIGAYTTAILVDTHGWSPGWTFPAAALVSFAVGVLVGIPALRLTGVYLTLITLALAQIFPALVRKFDFTGGSFGITSLSYEPPSFTGLETDRAGEAKWLYVLGLVLLGLGYVLVRNLVKSRVGRAMVAVRDNALAAGVMGVNVSFTKAVTFGLSAALAGVAGSLYVLRQSQATPDDLTLTILGAILFLVIMVIGGSASLLGPIIGAFVYYRVNEFTIDLTGKSWLPGWFNDFLEGRANLATLVFAALLVVLMFIAPFGIVGAARQLGRRVVQIVPKPPTGPSAADVDPSTSTAGAPTATAPSTS